MVTRKYVPHAEIILQVHIFLLLINIGVKITLIVVNVKEVLQAISLILLMEYAVNHVQKNNFSVVFANNQLKIYT